jgi:hypothetical protein
MEKEKCRAVTDVVVAQLSCGTRDLTEISIDVRAGFGCVVHDISLPRAVW